MAGSFFSELGLKLVDDPTLILNPYQMTAATYKSNQGLFLRIGFDPADSNSAIVAYGRQWRGGGGWSALSNRYAALVKRFGVDVPAYYDLGHGDEIAKTMQTILDDLKRTLPVVMQRTTLNDLVAVESEEFGARRTAAAYFGPHNLESVEVSAF
jgi:hypothetical protein